MNSVILNLFLRFVQHNVFDFIYLLSKLKSQIYCLANSNSSYDRFTLSLINIRVFNVFKVPSIISFSGFFICYKN